MTIKEIVLPKPSKPRVLTDEEKRRSELRNQRAAEKELLAKIKEGRRLKKIEGERKSSTMDGNQD